jgi:hypothetical protein
MTDSRLRAFSSFISLRLTEGEIDQLPDKILDGKELNRFERAFLACLVEFRGRNFEPNLKDIDDELAEHIASELYIAHKNFGNKVRIVDCRHHG